LKLPSFMGQPPCCAATSPTATNRMQKMSLRKVRVILFKKHVH
jgi:hypothetical protein